MANMIGLAKQAVRNNGKVFAVPVATSEGGVTSYKVYTAQTLASGETSLRDVTKTLKGVPGADGKFRGRPRNDTVLRAAPADRARASTVLGRQIASALYGAEGKVTVQEL